jgi:hypothetical protein
MMCSFVGWCSLTLAEQAAWAQAAAALVQALLTVWTVRWVALREDRRHREEQRRRVDSIVALVESVLTLAEEAVQKIDQGSVSESKRFSWSGNRWGVLTEACKAAALHSLPDWRLVSPLRVAAEASEVFYRRLEAEMPQSRASFRFMTGVTNDEELRSKLAELQAAYAQAAEVSNELEPRGLLRSLRKTLGQRKGLRRAAGLDQS